VPSVPAGPALPATLGSRRRKTERSNPLFDGTLTVIGFASVRTASSLSATTSVEVTRMPPTATPSATVRVSSIWPTIAPFELRASAAMLTV
jgi:hypothetical protein